MSHSRKFPPVGVSPAVWGPIFWNAMHVVTLGYPQIPSAVEQDAVIAYFESLQHVIPCPICREHYSHFLKEMPVRDAAGSRDAIIEWLFNLHNKVNVQLDKSAITWEQYIEHIRTMQDFDSGSRMNPKTIASCVALGCIVGIAGYALYTKYK